MTILKKIFFLLVVLLFQIGNAQNKEVTPSLKFVQLTDLHVTQGNDNDQLLRDIVEEINQSDQQFVVVTGDLSNRGSDEELQYVYDILKKLKVPYYIISGNHETTWSESAGLTYKKLWGPDRFVFSKGDYLFIGFPCGPYMKMGDGFVKHEDVLWLNQTLKDSLAKGYKKVINFAHYPLDKSVSNYKEVLEVLAKYPTVVSFCGHGHTLKKYNFSGLSGVMGTALTTRDGKTQSYNTVTVESDSIRIYRKQIGLPQKLEVTIPNAVSTIVLPEEDVVPTEIPFVRDVASIYSLPTFDKTKLFFCNSLGEVKAIDLKSKKVKWKVETGNSLYFNPRIVEHILVVGTIDGMLMGLDAKSGKTKWKLQLNSLLVGSPLIDGNTLYTSTASEFVSVDVLKGKVIWKNSLPKSYSQGTPFLQENMLFFGNWDAHLYGLNKQSGELIWKWNNDKPTQLLYSPGNVNVVATAKRVYMVSPERYLTILDKNTGKTLLRTNKWKVREAMGRSQDGNYFYAKTMDGELLRLPLNDDLTLTEENLVENSIILNLNLGYDHNPAAILEHQNKIYIGSRKGEVVIVDALSMKLLQTIVLGNSSVNGFTTDQQGQVWTSLIEGTLFKLP